MKEYIYTLNDPDTNIVKYIGKSKNVRKRYIKHLCVEKKDEHTKKGRWINKLKSKNKKPKLLILDESDSEHIYDLERYWISQFRSWGFDLCNTTDGGKGGKYKLTENDLEKMMMNHPCRKEVLQFDIEGNLIEEYVSVREAGRKLGIHRSGISRCCKGQLKTSGGFIFKYKNDFNKKLLLNEDLKKHISFRKVKQFDLSGNFIKEYRSVNNTSVELNIHRNCISRCCKGHLKTSGGYIFKYS